MYHLIIEHPVPSMFRLVLAPDGNSVAPKVPFREFAFSLHVDNTLLTAIDNFLQENTIHKSAISKVVCGDGIDKDSSFGRIVQSLAAAIHGSG